MGDWLLDIYIWAGVAFLTLLGSAIILGLEVGHV